IALRLDDSIKGDEAYRLNVTPSHIEITASDERGLFWGVQTLRQLLAHEGSHRQVPAVRIDDAPAYPWRGAMLDVARHFFPVEYVEKQIDLMSYYKLDVFHWHLTDDQGWRIQIERYPKLTSVGAWRTETNGSRYGGYYTQDQIREVVDYAHKRNVMVVPEIEMPGHTSAAIAAYPELSCSGKQIAVPTGWGVFKNADCVGNDSTFEFLQNILDEVIALFPSPYIHIGGDEVPQDVWQDCDSCQKLANAQGLKGEEGLHGWFVERIRKYLAGKGKTLVGWDEILEGHLDPGAVVESWRGDAASEQALANGNRVIVAGPFYFDTPIDDMTLQDVYRTDAFADAAYAAHRAQVLGAEAPLWAERVTPLNGDAMFWPRLMAFAERLWNPDARDYADFNRRVQTQHPWLAAQRVAYGPEDKDIVDYRLSYNADHQRWRVRAARGFDDLQLHYTTDGSEPTMHSPWFGDVLDLYSPPNTLKIAPVRNGVQYHTPAAFQFAGNGLALGKPLTYATPPAAQYSGVLNDGILGSTDFRDGSWAGWQGADMDATIDLQQTTPLHSIDVHFLQESGAWILLPREVGFAVSDDGKHWKTLQTLPLNPDPQDPRTSIRDVRFDLAAPVNARYLRLTATRYGKPVEGLQTWIFCDEIIVR
ncbi:MAG TPA: family 20 glycosylhydrolase, partial [Rhodanobacteraceae bacterium]|nr:family 20 glycosylhydrolase [Rhodanobacteraceae bacterium]